MAATSTEQAVLSLFRTGNKPYSVQNLVDLLAHAGHKKAPITKALDSLTASGEILAKEFGKTKIFLPNQKSKEVLDKADYDGKTARVAMLTKQLQEEQAACKQLEQELATWRNALTVEEMQRQIPVLQAKLATLKAKADALKGGAVLVSAADRAAAEKALTTALDAWRRRKSMFKGIWASVSESMEGQSDAEALEEMGVDTDESVGADLKALEALVSGAGKRGALGGATGAVKRLRT